MKHSGRALLGILIFLGACSQGKISERDIKRQQQQDQVSLKKQELESVSGTYSGLLKNEAGTDRDVILKLEVKDVASQPAGGVDPVVVPKLVGFLRFQFGGSDSKEYIDAPLSETEFNLSQSTVYAVATHPQFDRMILRLEFEEPKLVGTWSASAVGASGTLDLSRDLP